MTKSDFIIQVHHVGGRDGELGELPININFINDIIYHVYDPDESCMPQIEIISKSRGLKYKLHPYVVDNQDRQIEFRLNHCPCTSSLLSAAEFKPEQYSPLSLMGDYIYRNAFNPVESISVMSVSLDQLVNNQGNNVDFLSVDVQGGEARVFQGAREQLSRHTVGIVCEVEFHELYKDQPLFGDIHKMMQEKGFNFMRFFMREARVNYFRAGVGFRGDGMLMSCDALFLRDPDKLVKEVDKPYASLFKLAYVALSFGFIEYALDCLQRATELPEHQKIDSITLPDYVRFLLKVWCQYKISPYIPQPSFAELYTVAEAKRRFDPDNPHPWSTFDRDRVLKSYFSVVDAGTFFSQLPKMLSQNDSDFEQLLRDHAMDAVADLVREKRIKHATMIVESLQLGRICGDHCILNNADELYRLGILTSKEKLKLTPEEIRSEADRLSKLSGWEGGPAEGWQYPFDLGYGIVTRTYTDVQSELHPWRKNVLLKNLDKHFAGKYHELSVLDLGACEGSMSLALWEKGVRDITCVETRAINVEKARFVFKVKHADIRIVQDDVLSFLQKDRRKYDLVLFMGLLYHLLDPFLAIRLTAQHTSGLLAMETVVANPKDLKFENEAHYSPSNGGFFVRHDSSLCNTAGLSNLELWPNREGLESLLTEAGFTEIDEMDYGTKPNHWYATGQRVMLLASHN